MHLWRWFAWVVKVATFEFTVLITHELMDRATLGLLSRNSFAGVEASKRPHTQRCGRGKCRPLGWGAGVAVVQRTPAARAIGLCCPSRRRVGRHRRLDPPDGSSPACDSSNAHQFRQIAGAAIQVSIMVDDERVEIRQKSRRSTFAWPDFMGLAERTDYWLLLLRPGDFLVIPTNDLDSRILGFIRDQLSAHSWGE